MCGSTSDAQSRCIRKNRCKETEMFPSNEMVMAAEVAYRRERLQAIRPKRRFRPIRRRSAAKVRNAPKHGQYVTAA